VLAFLVRRLGLGALVVVAVSFLSWLIFVPALNPLWRSYIDPNNPQALAAAKRAHLHDPLLVRYWLWAKGLFTGQGFGRTVVDQTPIGAELRSALARTGELLAFSLVIILVISVLLAVVEARRRDSALDLGLRTTSYFVWSIPTFLLGLWLIHGFAAAPRSWHLVQFVQGGPPTGIGDAFQRLTVPALAVALGFVGVYSRYLRSSLVLSLNEPYAWVARGKGLSEGAVIRHHVLRNAFVPFTTAMTLDFGSIIGATIAVDLLFGLGGLANLIYDGVVNLADPFVVEAAIVVTAAIVVVAGIVGDVVCAWLDPRIRLA
jgi:peptide/nickel transport system permease protein